MTTQNAIDWFREMLWTAVLTAGPPVVMVVVVGLVIAVLQAATQINDQAVSFGPKALSAVAALIVSASWIISQISEFMTSLFAAIGNFRPN